MVYVNTRSFVIDEDYKKKIKFPINNKLADCGQWRCIDVDITELNNSVVPVLLGCY